MNNANNPEQKKGPIAWMAGHPVAANLLMAFFLVGGFIVLSQIKQEVFPAFDRGAVFISVPYPGSGPEEVERGIILAIEEAVEGLDNVDEILSTASEGRAFISVEAIEGTDLGQFSQEIKSEIDAITTFPEEAEEPRVTVSTRKREVVSYVVYGNQEEKILREKAEQLRDMLLQDPKITQVMLDGVRDYEIQVNIPMDQLRRYNLTIGEVADRIREISIELPGGSLKTAGGEILVRMKERRDVAKEYAEISVITHADGSRVRLGDIADIQDGFAEFDIYATFNGKPAVMVEVYRIGDQKPIEVARAVKARIDLFQVMLPEGIDIALVRDRSETYGQRAELLIKNGLMGLCLVFIFLALFLEIRLAFWVSLGIPISMLGAFLFLPVTDFSINLISMFAFIVTLGIVVDDAIVVGENIYYNRQEGMEFLPAAIHGAREIAVPVCFSIFTNIIAFIPMFFVPGVLGKIFKLIPMVVITVFAVSLIESLFILPAHLGHQNRPVNNNPVMRWLATRQQMFGSAFTGFVKTRYGAILDLVLRHRYITVAVGIAIFTITVGYIMSGRMGMTLFPRVESDYAYVNATLPYGTSALKVSAVQNQIVNAAQQVVDENGGEKLSKGIFSHVRENVVTARVYLTPPKIRTMSTAALTEAWRDAVDEIPGLEFIMFQSDRGGPGSGKSLTVELSHRSIPVLKAASRGLAEELAFFPKVKDVDDGSAKGKQQFDFKMLPQGELRGFRARDVAVMVRHAFYGAEALRLQRERNEVKIIVRLPEEERNSQYALDNLIIRATDGREALLREVVTMTPGRAYTSIDRRAGRRVVSITADVVPRSETNTVIATLKSEILPALQDQYPGLTFSFEGRQAEMRESIDSLITGLLIALLVIYCMLAIPFRSYFQPLIIMSCIPFGIVGVVVGHLLMGYSLSVMSLFGVVALTGVVVNDSLILIDFTNRRRNNGMTAFDAIHASGIHRFRPIILTTLTTFGGLSPMIFETSRQARFMIPMAVSLGFGIVFATLITLVLVPSLYMIIEDMAVFFKKETETGMARRSQ